MGELLSCDRYQVYAMGQLSPLSYSVLSQLYQPIIGAKAYGLYLYLYSEVDVMKMLSIESNHSRISSYTALSLHQVKENMKKLEAIGLVKSYIRYESEMTKYLYELLMPMSPQQFFQNDLLNVLLYRTLGSLEYDKTRFLFRLPEIDLNGYDEVTANFEEVFFIDETSTEGSQILKYKGNYRKEESKAPVMDYPLDLFYRQLQELQVRRKWITPAVETKVKQLGLAYHISGQKMAQLVYDAIDHQRINLDILAKKVRDYNDLESPRSFTRIYHQQPINFSSSEQADNAKSRHIQQLETWSPYKLIEKKQGGKPVRRDLAIIEKLMVDLNLEPGVVNVLLELTWSQNDERISRDFVESIGATWKRKNIHTVEQAMQEAKNYIRYKNKNNQDITPEWFKDQQAEKKLQAVKEDQQLEENDISDEELRALLKSI